MTNAGETDEMALAHQFLSLAHDGKKVKSELTSDEKLRLLKENYSKVLDKQQKFNPGDLVSWKSGLKNRTKPNYSEPAIVIDVLESPIFDSTNNSGSPYFKEPLDIIVGFVDDDGDFLTMYYDSRRFERIL